MADPIVRLAARLTRPPAPALPGQRWEVADLLARVDAALARRAA